ncbi:unnamed protein product [Prorocentrum cordatum]|uniref:RidA family protein n=1 Tax=Prorocentrum cordatum TaxID=2364126 RepID=A0ABN9Q2C8_9DINO|nr:unnamed protein product [Polarella glacialis]
MAFEVKQLPGHTPDFPRLQVQSGTSWEGIAGFSRALRLGDRVCISGTTPTRQGRAVGGDDAGAQTTFALDIAEASLRALGGSLADVLRTRLYVRRLEDWEAVARAHGQRFREHHPANTLVQAGLVGEEYLVEVELEALLGPRAA